MVADQDVKALVEDDPLEELLPPPAHALMRIGKNTKVIFFIFHLFFMAYQFLINPLGNIVKRNIP